ncbi:MAG: hypothetical protein [Myoviridae sp. ctThM1]|nr:MAG: hypothetical protein [Myoviridae sp. ctThM1]
MKKWDKDELYLLVDFLEEKLENARDMEYVGYSEDELEEFAVEETMFELSIEVIKTLIKE